MTTVLFDLDGTLVDSLYDLTNGLNVLRASHNLPAMNYEDFRDVVSLGTDALMLKAIGVTPTDEHYARSKQIFHSHYEEHIADETKPFNGVMDVLETLEQNKLRWGVITDKNHALSKRLLTQLDLFDRCAILIGGDTASARKPDAAPLLLACEKLNVTPDECVYVGDARRDIDCAKNAGICSVAAMYGYIPPDAKPEDWGADYYIDKPGELLGWLFKM